LFDQLASNIVLPVRLGPLEVFVVPAVSFPKATTRHGKRSEAISQS
jgi:hypothetical protein